MRPAFVPLHPGYPNRGGWVVDENGCHLWTGAKDSTGRGVTTDRGKRWQVHRLRYVFEVGPIPEGMELDHFACDGGARGCCNPHHCRPVTHRENMLRGQTIAAANAAKTHCPKGHELTPENCVPSVLKQGWRLCRICRNAYQRERQAARRGEAARG